MALQAKIKKSVSVRVTTMDADLEFCIERDALGSELFDQVCRTIGVREIWYFGLQFTSTKGSYSWLRLDKKVLSQDIGKAEPYHFLFLAKFFPEDVNELIQEITQHLFYLQTQQSILSQDIFCPPEASVLLASYAVQAKNGDFDSSRHSEDMLQLDELLPKRVIEQYQMTTAMWQDRIATWWANNKGYSREDAEMEYLRISQDLDMFGVTYFAITNKNSSELLLGATPVGVQIYEKVDNLRPKMSFAWGEIRNISFKNKKFTIKTNDKSSTKPLHFISVSSSLNKVILDVCVGYHNLYLRRRQPDSLELQQMKTQSKEDRLRRQQERHRLEVERNLRTELECDRERLQSEISQLQQQIQAAQEALRRSEETADLLAEKARISEEEALMLAKRASEAEAEIQRIRIAAIKTQEEKILIEQKAREAQLIAARILEESEKRSKEADRLKEDLAKSKQAERHAKDRLRDLMVNPYTPLYGAPSGIEPMGGGEHFGPMGAVFFAPPNGELGGSGGCLQDVIAERDLKSLSAELEKERAEYFQRSHHLQEQLSELRSEIEGLKVEDRDSDYERNYVQGLGHLGDKYASLRRSDVAIEESRETDKSGAGSAKSRVALFDGL